LVVLEIQRAGCKTEGKRKQKTKTVGPAGKIQNPNASHWKTDMSVWASEAGVFGSRV
jgi:hypothetical protein